MVSGSRFKQGAIFRALLLASLTFSGKPLFGWEDLHDGWQHRTIKEIRPNGGETRIHFFRLDPRKVRLNLLFASDFQAAALPAKRYREKSGASFVVNGGFFDETLTSLGLLVRRGETVNPLRNADWGIFQMKAGLPSIIHRRQWNPDGVETAVQAGPRLVIDGRTPSFKPEPEPHRRTALGITPDGWLLVALCDTPIEIRPWAEALQKEAVAALNLDGGGSSQLSMSLKGFVLELPGTANVPNAVAVFGK